MSGRIHDRSHFFKYASRKTALRVIETRSFRWSSPTKFNDPFDHQTGFVLNVNMQHFADLLTASIERLIFGEAPPQANPPTLFTSLILPLRAIRERLPRERILQDLHEASVEVAQSMDDNIDRLNSVIQEQLLHSRVFCVSEVHDNVVMWAHYSEEHQGVVFKLRCDDELDNTLLAARKVQYTNEFIQLPGAEVYAKHLTGEEPLDLTPLVWQIAFTKHRDWAYEREWRVHMPMLDEPPGDGYTIMEEDPKIFEAVYLGCRMPSEDVIKIAQAIQQHFPKTRIFKAEKSGQSFSLDFKEIDGS